MILVPLAVLWAGYTITWYGYVLTKGPCLGLLDLVLPGRTAKVDDCRATNHGTVPATPGTADIFGGPKEELAPGPFGRQAPAPGTMGA